MSSESDESDSLSPPLSSSPIPRVSSNKSRTTSYRRIPDTQHEEVEMASITYPTSLVKDNRKGGCREKEKRPGLRKRDSRLKMEILRRSLLSSFDETPLDGCLSGF
jgi:hypothetical protein